MSARFETRARIGGIICVLIGAYAWVQFISGMTDGIEFSLNLDMLLLPVGISLLNAGPFWRFVTTILLAGLTLILVLMTGLLIAMDPQEFAGILNSDLNVSPRWIQAGMATVQVLYIAAVLAIYYAMIEGKLVGPGAESAPAPNGSAAT